jgi:hypothetical protein
MAFADPQAVTIDSASVDLPRTGFGPNSGRFTSADGEVSLEISHQSGGRLRHLVRLTDAQTVSNPLVPDQNIAVNMSAHLVIDMPRNGYTTAEIADLAAALTTWATEANLLKVVSGES